MQVLLSLVALAGFIVTFVCFIMVVIQMFKHDQQVMGAVSILAFFLVCCPGFLVGLVMGWMNAAAWGIQNLMYAYTAGFIVWLGAGVVNSILYGTPQVN